MAFTEREWELVKTRLRYNPETGKVLNLKGYPVGSLHKRHGYIMVTMNKKKDHAHRVAWFLHHNEVPNIIDHINGDRTDNRISNLRNTDHFTNQANRHKLNHNNTSGTAGIFYVKARDRWLARYIRNRTRYQVGFFRTQERAIEALTQHKQRMGFL